MQKESATSATKTSKQRNGFEAVGPYSKVKEIISRVGQSKHNGLLILLLRCGD